MNVTSLFSPEPELLYGITVDGKFPLWAASWCHCPVSLQATQNPGLGPSSL